MYDNLIRSVPGLLLSVACSTAVLVGPVVGADALP